MATPADDLIAHSPILNWGLVALTFIASAIAVWRGTAARRGSGERDPADVVVEIKHLLERMERTLDSGRVEMAATAASNGAVLQGIYRVAGEQRADNARFADEQNSKLDTATEILRRIERNTDRPLRR